MYISGSLKRKTIDKYREDTIGFDKEGISFGKFYFGYDGEIIYPPFDKDIEHLLFKKQENYIREGKDKILKIADELKNSKYMKEILNNLQNMDRKFAFALYEQFYNILNLNNDEIYLKLFYDLTEYLKKYGNNINQIDFEIILMLFRNGLTYNNESVDDEKSCVFPLYTNKSFKMLNEHLQAIIKMGMFISPNRVSNIKKSDINNELCEYYLPIYFLIKDNILARDFLISINNGFENIADIKENARDLGISKSLIRKF